MRDPEVVACEEEHQSTSSSELIRTAILTSDHSRGSLPTTTD